MTALDWIIIAFTVLMAVWGYSQGLIVGALSLAGFVAGALLGSRLAPLLLEEGSNSPYAPMLSLVGALVVGGVLASAFELLGFRLRHRIGERLGILDGIGGALLVAALGLGLVWVGGAVALQTPGAKGLREPIQQSAILGELNERLPPSGSILKALARFDPFPQIEGPDPDVRAPDAKIARDPEVRRAGRSVVRILGTACGLGVQGSGWVAADGVVVTNAHVVAGQDDTTVQVEGEGDRIDAEAIWFDSRNDLAVLSVPGLPELPALRLNGGAAAGHVGRHPRLSEERALRRAARPPRPDLHRRHPGRLRARARAALDHLAARPCALGQLGRPDGRRARARGDHDLRRHRAGWRQ